jgi:hypothetical protein
MAALIAHSEVVDVEGGLDVDRQPPVMIFGQSYDFAVLTLQGKVELETSSEVRDRLQYIYIYCGEFKNANSVMTLFFFFSFLLGLRNFVLELEHSLSWLRLLC